MKRRRKTFQTGLPRDTAFTTSQKTAVLSVLSISEVAARNLRALKLYHKNGYNCLNTVTIRKDFEPDNFEVIEKNNIAGFDFEIKRYIKKGE